MKKSKIYIALSHLNIYELNSFKKFVGSPYFNANEKLSKYYEYLEKYLKGRKEGEIHKEDIWYYVNPGAKFDDIKFRKLTSDLLKLLERFLAQQVYDKNNLNIAINLLEKISKKKIMKLYNSVLATADRLSLRHIDRNSDYYYYLYVFEKNKFNLTSEFEKKSKKKQKYNWLNLDKIGENLDVFYIGEKLKLYTTLASWKRVYKLDIDLNFIDEVIDFVKKIDYEKFPPVAIYYQIYLTIVDNENVEHYHKLKDMISKHIDSFPKEEAGDIYDSALNYCIHRINSGETGFYKEILSLYREMIDHDMIVEEEGLNPTRFRNIVITALRLKEYEWAEEFIDKYKDFIPEKYRANAVTFNLARLYYYKKDYKKVIEHLRDVEFDDMFYELSSKTILIKTYYDTGEVDPLYFLLDSFNAFLNRNKRIIPDRRRKNYKLLIKFVKKLLNVNPFDKDEVKKLKTEIKNSNNFPDKQWVIEKAEEL